MKKEDVLILHKEDRTIENAKTLQWFYGLKDRANPNIEVGIATFFEINEIENNSLRGNIELQRNWKEPIATGFEIQRKSFPAIFEIGGGTGFFLSGVMPRRSHLENENELIAIDIYKILRSPRFKAGESEFVVFVEFKKDN